MLKFSDFLSTNKNTCSKMAKSWLYILLALVIGVFCGWLIGRQREVEIKETVRYFEGPTTTIAIEDPTPIKTEPIKSFTQPEPIHDTIIIREEVMVAIPADTAGIISDYLQKRVYDLDFSTDTTGTFRVNAIVEANHLTSATATIAPLQKEIKCVIYPVPPKFRPTIGAGIVVSNNIGVTADVGAIIKDKHIVQAFYMRIDKQNFYGARYGIVFGKR